MSLAFHVPNCWTEYKFLYEMHRTMTDTKIRHVTPPGANIFTELGFPPEEAERLNADLHAEVDQALTLKRQLKSRG